MKKRSSKFNKNKANDKLFARITKSKEFLKKKTTSSIPNEKLLPILSNKKAYLQNIYGVKCKELTITDSCFCGHKLSSHELNNNQHKCKLHNCSCKHFRYFPNSKNEIIANEENQVYVMLRKEKKEIIHLKDMVK